MRINIARGMYKGSSRRADYALILANLGTRCISQCSIPHSIKKAGAALFREEGRVMPSDRSADEINEEALA